MSRKKKARRRRRDHSPGSGPRRLVPVDEALPTEMHVLRYGPQELSEEGPVAYDSIQREQEGQVLWVDVVGTGDVSALEALGSRFGLHPLALEDVVNLNQRPKLEAYGDDLFIVVRMCVVDGDAHRGETEQLSILLRQRLVITFQERPGDSFGRVRERLRRQDSRLRSRGADYLAYALLDAVIDGYQPVLDSFEERVEEIEDRLLESPEAEDLRTLHALRRDLIALRRGIAPSRDVVLGLMREPESVAAITDDTRLFLRDCYDHVIRTVDQIDTFRELCASLMDLYLSTISNRTNDVMKVLTIIATVFIPLSFLTGLYGMNFDTDFPLNMPELKSPYGYPALVAVMAGIALAFLAYFKKKDWF